MTILDPAFKPCLPWRLHSMASLLQKILVLHPAPCQLRGSCSPTLLSFIPRNLTFSPSLSCFPSLLRDLPVPGGVAELLCLHTALSHLPLGWVSSPLFPSPCYYLEFLPPLPLPLYAASSCSLCALDSFVPRFRNTL